MRQKLKTLYLLIGNHTYIFMIYFGPIEILFLSRRLKFLQLAKNSLKDLYGPFYYNWDSCSWPRIASKFFMIHSIPIKILTAGQKKPQRSLWSILLKFLQLTKNSLKDLYDLFYSNWNSYSWPKIASKIFMIYSIPIEILTAGQK